MKPLKPLYSDICQLRGQFFSPAPFVCTAMLEFFFPLFSYIIKTSGKWKYENANTQGDTFEATMEPDKCTDSVDSFSFNLFLVTWFQLWQEIKWKNLHKLLETFPQTLYLKGHVQWWRKMGKSLKLWIENQIKERKKIPSVILIQREMNRSIELSGGRWFAPDSLIIKRMILSFLLTHFFTKVDDTIRIAPQLPK